MSSVMWAGPRLSRSLGSARTQPVRLRMGFSTDAFGYELTCGLPPQARDDPTLFKLDPEVKEEEVWIEMADSKRVILFQRGPSGTWIRDESGRRVSYSGELSLNEGVLSQLSEPHLYPELWALRLEMTHWRFYHHFRTDVDSPLRAPQIGVRTPVLTHDGSDLAASLQTIFENGDGPGLQEEIQRAFNGAALTVETSSGRFSISLQMPGLLRPLHAAELSDGTLRYLCLLAALMSPRPARLLALNEPETSLHPDLLDGLARMIVRASKQSQLWITTHSTQLANAIQEYSGQPCIRLELVNGETSIAEE